ncbi:hypothetical protein CEXT_236151 [Caerostris extrusa]|uniref:Uncharacterized protein n=1 Tax=Caerostris extrusa TaxID=172846 RepID=A0AAV4SGW3_CAEEX|nr:hypothetical protein CEXT_236151 [Caerostris extrusa]
MAQEKDRSEKKRPHGPREGPFGAEKPHGPRERPFGEGRRHRPREGPLDILIGTSWVKDPHGPKRKFKIIANIELNKFKRFVGPSEKKKTSWPREGPFGEERPHGPREKPKYGLQITDILGPVEKPEFERIDIEEILQRPDGRPVQTGIFEDAGTRRNVIIKLLHKKGLKPEAKTTTRMELERMLRADKRLVDFLVLIGILTDIGAVDVKGYREFLDLLRNGFSGEISLVGQHFSGFGGNASFGGQVFGGFGGNASFGGQGFSGLGHFPGSKRWENCTTLYACGPDWKNDTRHEEWVFEPEVVTEKVWEYEAGEGVTQGDSPGYNESYNYMQAINPYGSRLSDGYQRAAPPEEGELNMLSEIMPQNNILHEEHVDPFLV